MKFDSLFKKNLKLIAWIISSLYIIYGTLIPFDFSFQVNITQNLRQANYIPYCNFMGRRTSLSDVISNILLFIPYGFLLCWILREKTFSLSKSQIICLVSSFLLSLSIEFLQLFFTSRTTSLTDIINNVLGTYIGCILNNIYLLYLKDRLSYQINIIYQRNPLVIFLIVYSLVLLVMFMFPFDISIQISDIKTALKQTNIVPFSSRFSFVNSAINIFTFIIFGFVGYIVFRTYYSKISAIFITLFLGFCLAILIEFFQIFIVSRILDINGIIIRLMGTLLGILISLINFLTV